MHISFRTQVYCTTGYESVKIKTTEMTRDNVLARTQQFKLPLMLSNLIWDYAFILILQNGILKYEW